jgi:hypothetical protein
MYLEILFEGADVAPERLFRGEAADGAGLRGHGLEDSVDQGAEDRPLSGR